VRCRAIWLRKRAPGHRVPRGAEERLTGWVSGGEQDQPSEDVRGHEEGVRRAVAFKHEEGLVFVRMAVERRRLAALRGLLEKDERALRHRARRLEDE
jgi:hypothetical protein